MRYISTREAAKKLELSRETVRRYALNGTLPAIITGKKDGRKTIRIIADQFDNYITASEVTAFITPTIPINSGAVITENKSRPYSGGAAIPEET